MAWNNNPTDRSSQVYRNIFETGLQGFPSYPSRRPSVENKSTIHHSPILDNIISNPSTTTMDDNQHYSNIGQSNSPIDICPLVVSPVAQLDISPGMKEQVTYTSTSTSPMMPKQSPQLPNAQCGTPAKSGRYQTALQKYEQFMNSMGPVPTKPEILKQISVGQYQNQSETKLVIKKVVGGAGDQYEAILNTESDNQHPASVVDNGSLQQLTKAQTPQVIASKEKRASPPGLTDPDVRNINDLLKMVGYKYVIEFTKHLEEFSLGKRPDFMVKYPMVAILIGLNTQNKESQGNFSKAKFVLEYIREQSKILYKEEIEQESSENLISVNSAPVEPPIVTLTYIGKTSDLIYQQTESDLHGNDLSPGLSQPSSGNTDSEAEVLHPATLEYFSDESTSTNQFETIPINSPTTKMHPGQNNMLTNLESSSSVTNYTNDGYLKFDARNIRLSQPSSNQPIASISDQTTKERQRSRHSFPPGSSSHHNLYTSNSTHGDIQPTSHSLSAGNNSLPSINKIYSQISNKDLSSGVSFSNNNKTTMDSDLTVSCSSMPQPSPSKQTSPKSGFLSSYEEFLKGRQEKPLDSSFIDSNSPQNKSNISQFSRTVNQNSSHTNSVSTNINHTMSHPGESRSTFISSKIDQHIPLNLRNDIPASTSTPVAHQQNVQTQYKRNEHGNIFPLSHPERNLKNKTSINIDLTEEAIKTPIPTPRTPHLPFKTEDQKTDYGNYYMHTSYNKQDANRHSNQPNIQLNLTKATPVAKTGPTDIALSLNERDVNSIQLNLSTARPYVNQDSHGLPSYVKTENRTSNNEFSMSKPNYSSKTGHVNAVNWNPGTSQSSSFFPQPYIKQEESVHSKPSMDYKMSHAKVEQQSPIPAPGDATITSPSYQASTNNIWSSSQHSHNKQSSSKQYTSPPQKRTLDVKQEYDTIYPGLSEEKKVKLETTDLVDRLAFNNAEQVPSCQCLRTGYDEMQEGPYYTHLGAAANMVEMRKLMERRLGITGNALRIEKILYTGKEGKNPHGCPIAKWVIRRSGPAEKALVITRPRKGHHCETAVIIVGICIWDGVQQKQADTLYDYMTDVLPNYGNETERRCGTNEKRTCACQGWDGKSGGASFTFGCSWSMYYNGCKFARSHSPRKFRLTKQSEEPILEKHLQILATQLSPLYKQVAPDSYRNMVYFEDIARDCRLGFSRGSPFSGVTAVVDFSTHAHKDNNNMNNGCTMVVTLTKHRGFSKPKDEQLHVLPLCIMDTTDENGTSDGQYQKICNGSIEFLTKYSMKMRIRGFPMLPCKQRKKLGKNVVGYTSGKRGRKPGISNKIKAAKKVIKNCLSNIRGQVREKVTNFLDPKTASASSYPKAVQKPATSNIYSNETSSGYPRLLSKYSQSYKQKLLQLQRANHTSAQAFHKIRQDMDYPYSRVKSAHYHNTMNPPMQQAVDQRQYYNNITPSYPVKANVMANPWHSAGQFNFYQNHMQWQQWMRMKQIEDFHRQRSLFDSRNETYTTGYYQPPGGRTSMSAYDTQKYGNEVASNPFEQPSNKILGRESPFQSTYGQVNCLPQKPTHSVSHYPSKEYPDSMQSYKGNSLPNQRQSVIGNQVGHQSAVEIPSFPSYLQDTSIGKPTVSQATQENRLPYTPSNYHSSSTTAATNPQSGAFHSGTSQSTVNSAYHAKANQPKDHMLPSFGTGVQNSADSLQNKSTSQQNINGLNLFNQQHKPEVPSFNPAAQQQISNMQANIKEERDTGNTQMKPEATIKEEPNTIEEGSVISDPMAGAKEIDTDCEDSFRDSDIGGVAIALTHGSVLFECAKKELHATTAMRKPDRRDPTRISLVFYQHKNLNLSNHGYEEYLQKAEMWKQRRESKKLKEEAEAAQQLIKTEHVKEEPTHSHSQYMTNANVANQVSNSNAISQNRVSQPEMYQHPKQKQPPMIAEHKISNPNVVPQHQMSKPEIPQHQQHKQLPMFAEHKISNPNVVPQHQMSKPEIPQHQQQKQLPMFAEHKISNPNVVPQHQMSKPEIPQHQQQKQLPMFAEHKISNPNVVPQHQMSKPEIPQHQQQKQLPMFAEHKISNPHIVPQHQMSKPEIPQHQKLTPQQMFSDHNRMSNSNVATQNQVSKPNVYPGQTQIQQPSFVKMPNSSHVTQNQISKPEVYPGQKLIQQPSYLEHNNIPNLNAVTQNQISKPNVYLHQKTIQQPSFVDHNSSVVSQSQISKPVVFQGQKPIQQQSFVEHNKNSSVGLQNQIPKPDVYSHQRQMQQTMFDNKHIPNSNILPQNHMSKPHVYQNPTQFPQPMYADNNKMSNPNVASINQLSKSEVYPHQTQMQQTNGLSQLSQYQAQAYRNLFQ